MKIIKKENFEGRQLKSENTGELYSISFAASEKLGSRQIDAHHDIIPPAMRSSTSHRHLSNEEIVYILKGTAVISNDDDEVPVDEGSFVMFEPQSKKLHCIRNQAAEVLETLTFSIQNPFDTIVYNNDEIRKINLPPFHFDKNLREIPDNPKFWEDFIIVLKEELKHGPSKRRELQVLEHLGIAYRITNQLGNAEKYLKKAIGSSAGYGTPEKMFQNTIRLAHVYQWKKEFDKASVLFDQAKSIMNENEISDSLVASYFQHLGKFYFDQKCFKLAQCSFAAALTLRKNISSPVEQIESTKKSLDECLKFSGIKIPQDLRIRKAVLTDALGIHEAHMKSIQEICSKDHSPTEIKAWGYRPFLEDHRIDGIKNDFIWVVESKGKVEGFAQIRIFEDAGIKKSYLQGLYLTPQVSGKSVGKNLMNVIFEEVKLQKVKAIQLDSSLSAKNFYFRSGFSIVGPITSINVNSVPIQCYKMEMKFTF